MDTGSESLIEYSDVSILFHVSPEMFTTEIQPRRRPVVLRGLNFGDCTDKWFNIDYLIEKTEDKQVKIHVSTDPLRMDFRKKNFKYCSIGFHDLLRRTSLTDHEFQNCILERGEKYYLRSTGVDPRPKAPTIFEEEFPELATDFHFPDGYFPKGNIFSSVLRVSSPGIRVWTHYDVLDNFYVQIVGHKRAILWPPHQANNLYLDGDKSKVIDVDSPDDTEFPKFRHAERLEVELEPGDVLFIPALWFHNMTAKDFGMAVNIFWKNLEPALYDPKDPYGNKDLVPAARGLKMLDNVMTQLESLPDDYRDFYARQFIIKLESKCLQKPL